MDKTFGSAEQAAASCLIDLALAEDLGGRGDLTSEILIDEQVRGSVDIVAREPGILCGASIGQLALSKVDPSCDWTGFKDDGARVELGTCVATLSGAVRSLLTAERTILNFMTHLSGVAALTRRFVDAVQGTDAAILDTRKTLPGWRSLQKYAVRCGGGTNHRLGLWDAVLIKDNHLAACRDERLDELLVRVRHEVPAGVTLEIEVDSLDQLQEALRGDPDIVLLDNMDTPTLSRAVDLRNQMAPQVLLEASGGVRLDSAAEIARTGVDRISVGLLTHSAAALDLGFDWHS